MIRVLDVRQGDGTYVTSLEPHLLLDALSFVVDFHRDDTVLQFLEVRRILEPAATALAAERMTDDDVGKLQAVLDELGAEPTIEALVANDLEFHRQIAAGSGNAVLCSLIDGPVRPDHPGADLARADPGGRRRPYPGAAPGDPRRDRLHASPSWPAPGRPCTSPGVEEWLRRAL